MIYFACSVGITPAIITETLWALACLPEPVLPDRVEVFTTTPGKKLIQEQLLNSGLWMKFKASLEKKGLSVKNKLQFGDTAEFIHLATHQPEGGALAYELVDPQNAHELDSLANHLLTQLRRLTQDEHSTLIASLSGGRKTMSALFYSAFSMVKRSQDYITHVLCDDAVMSGTTPLFFWPMQEERALVTRHGRAYDAQKIALNLIHIPCISLRPAMHDAAPNASFTDHVSSLSKVIDAEHIPTLSISKTMNFIEIDGVHLAIASKAQMALLRVLASACKAGVQFQSRTELHEKWLEVLPGGSECVHEKGRLNSELSSLRKILKVTPLGERLSRFLPQGRQNPTLSLPPYKIEIK